MEVIATRVVDPLHAFAANTALQNTLALTVIIDFHLFVLDTEIEDQVKCNNQKVKPRWEAFKERQRKDRVLRINTAPHFGPLCQALPVSHTFSRFARRQHEFCTTCISISELVFPSLSLTPYVSGHLCVRSAECLSDVLDFNRLYIATILILDLYEYWKVLDRVFPQLSWKESTILDWFYRTFLTLIHDHSSWCKNSAFQTYTLKSCYIFC